MEFRVLGGLEVRDVDGRPVDLGPPKQRAVLAVLLLEVGRVVAADRLVDLLWGDDAPKARSSLQAYVSHLRRALEPDRGPGAEPAVLLTQAPGYRLAVDRAAIDVFRFEDLVAEGRTRLQRGDDPGAVAVLDEAFGLWTGPLLPELAGEGFVVDAADRVAGIAVGAAEVAAEARLRLGDAGSALPLLERAAADHPLRERLHALLALALYRSGRQADALRAVDRCRRALADAAGLDPGPELRRLEADLLAQSPTLDWRPVEPPTVPASGRTAGSAPRRPNGATAPSSGLVGRGDELAVLRSALVAAEAGEGGVVVVIGEPGIGKTRLAEELRREARGRGVVTAWARCSETGAAPPFWPAAQLGDELRAAGVISARLVAPPEGAEPTEASRARFDLQRAVVDALSGADTPLLLVIDDVQWADPDSLRLLENIAADLARARILVLLTSRPLDDDSPPALVECLAELARVPRSASVRLAGLPVDAVADWLGQRSDVAVPDEVVHVVHDRTAGNPLFVKELADLLAAEGRLGDAASVSAARVIPPGVQFVVRRRVARLPAATQQLLSVAAVIGRNVDVALVAAAAGCGAADALDVLAPAFDAGLLVSAGAGFRFSHALVADALADEVNASRRATVHAAVARAAAARAGTDLGTAAAVVAHHALEGMPAGTGELAADASRRAAVIASERFADEDAASHWANAAAALASASPADVAGRIDAWIEQARSLLRADLIEAAKAPALDAIDLAASAGRVEDMVRAAALFNHAHVWANEAYGVVDDRVVSALERTLAAVGDGDLVRRAEVLGALTAELVFAPWERHAAVRDEAVAAARAAGDPPTLASVVVAAVLPNRPDELELRRALAAEALALAEAHDLPAHIAFAGHHHAALCHLEVGDLDAAMDAHASARRAIERLPGSRFRSQLAFLGAALAGVRGRYDDAWELSAQASEIHRRARGYDADTLRIAGETSVLLDIGGFEPLRDFVRATLQTTSYARSTAEAVAWGMLELGDRETAIGAIGPFRGDHSFANDWTFTFAATAALHVRAELGLVEEVAPLLDLLAPYEGRFASSGSAPLSMGLVDLALARGAAALGDDDRARRHFEAAVAGHERMGAPAWLARSLVHQGQHLLRTGDAAGAAAGEGALVRARVLVDRHGFPYIRRRLDAG